MRILYALMLAPLLLAPVRLKDSTPGFFTPLGQGPAPESYSLPAAEPLVTPTVIYVSPTMLPAPALASPTQVTSTLNLPLPPVVPTPTVVQPPVASPPPNLMSPTAAAMCQRTMLLVNDLGMLSYEQKRNQSVLTLSLAAIAALPEVRALQWPTLNAFNKASKSIPWFQPQRAELLDAVAAAKRFCTN